MRAVPRQPNVIIAWMVLTLGVVGAIAYWDDRRESAAALSDFAHEQVQLARMAAGALGAGDEAREVEALRRIQEPDSVVVFLGAPHAGLRSLVGSAVHSEPIEQAVSDGREDARLSRPEAAALGLPARSAMAGIARAPDGRVVVVVASASRERDREIRAQWRLVLGFALAAAVVLGFGMLALRTQRKELEVARELAVAEAVRVRDQRLVRADKLATLGALATGIAHEVSTPLGVIVGRAEQLAPVVAGDERASRAVRAIAEQADRIGKIVRGILTLVRGGEADLERVAVSSLARDAVELVQHRFDEAGVTLASAPTFDGTIACEPKLFTQVLVNLLLNACDACERGGSVELRVERAGDALSFVVTDDGHGITAEDAARATEPFFTTKPIGKGTGLGLAIAHEIVSHHHGALRLSARSDGRGTEARVEIATSSNRETDNG